MRLESVRTAQPAVPAPPRPLAAGDELPRRRGRGFTRLPIKPKARREAAPPAAPPAAEAPMSCWHVWLADGLVAPAPEAAPAAETFADLFARAEAVAAQRAARYREHEAFMPAGAGSTLDLRA